MLPEIVECTKKRLNLTTHWQTVIFRNYRMVSNENIAKVLGCSAEDVEREALRLGLIKGEADPIWLTRGFITILRNNWHLLPYEQLMTLLGFSEERLDFLLANEDFLGIKLGHKKPLVDKVTYCPLTDEQISETEKVAKTVREFDTAQRKMFDFFNDRTDTEPQYFVSQDGGTRIVHGFLSPCGDPFADDMRSHLPDSLLDAYAKQGVNVLFLHAVLSTLSPYRYAPEYSEGYEARRENLKNLVLRAGKRGIKIYLYFDEPRSLPTGIFERYGNKEIEGRHPKRGGVCLCLSTEEPKEYLYSATKDLFEAIPELGGILNITWSEYTTHCLSHGRSDCDCPRCKDLYYWELPVLVNNIMHDAVRDSGSNAEVLSYAWGWQVWPQDELEAAFTALHPEIGVIQVSETKKEIRRGGVEVAVGDYSISAPGPSPIAENFLKTAARLGHKTFAKVQMSCSWEAAMVPYLPVFDLELEHLQNLNKIGTKNFMLTWTHGGYPSITFDMICDFMKSPDTFNVDDWYKKQFGDKAEKVHEAIKLCCEGFKNYPFSVATMYDSPKNIGPANMWMLEPDNNPTSMVCYSVDDYEKWIASYPVDVYLDLFGKVVEKWEKGCDILDSVASDEKTRELALFARVVLLEFKADIIHTEYAVAKRELPATKDKMAELIVREREVTKALLKLIPKSTLVGYEASNHYFFTEREYIEKLINLDGIEKELAQM